MSISAQRRTPGTMEALANKQSFLQITQQSPQYSLYLESSRSEAKGRAMQLEAYRKALSFWNRSSFLVSNGGRTMDLLPVHSRRSWVRCPLTHRFRDLQPAREHVLSSCSNKMKWVEKKRLTYAELPLIVRNLFLV